MGDLGGHQTSRRSRERRPWLVAAGVSALAHLALLWWLTGSLEAESPRLETPFVVDLVREAGEERVDARSGQGQPERTSGLEGERSATGETPAREADLPAAEPARAEAGAAQDVTGRAIVAPPEEELLPGRSEAVLESLQSELLERNRALRDLPRPRRGAPAPGDGGAPGALGSTEGVTGPLGERQLLHIELPEYPEWALREGIEAGVRFRFWVSPEGHVIRVETIHRSGYPELETLGREALLNWRFASLPAGRFQEEWGEVPIRWRLSEEGSGRVVTREGP